jgi:radical SAM protein with 4Fe4S-binding SPASM domain
LWDIIEYADRKDFLIELLTNATLMTETDVERLKNYRISNVQISVYGHSPEIHDSVTGVPGSFKRSMNIIHCLTANKINTLMVTPLMKINFPGYKKIMELANRMGANHYCSNLIIERYDGSKDVYDLRLSKDEILKFFSENPDEIPYKKRDINDAICTAGINQCSISPFGDVFPCFHNLLPLNLGNLMNQSLEDIWTHSKDLENFRDLKICHLNGCPECPAVSNCVICPGMNMRANNNLLEPAPVSCHNAFSAKEVFDRDSHSIDFEGRHIKKLEDFH